MSLTGRPKGEYRSAKHGGCLMSLTSIKLTLPPVLHETVPRRVVLGGYVNAGEYMRQLIRSDAKVQQCHRLRDRLAADETRSGGTPDRDSG